MHTTLGATVLAYGLTLFPTLAGEIVDYWRISNSYFHLSNAYNSIIAGTASSISNVFWRGNNARFTTE